MAGRRNWSGRNGFDYAAPGDVSLGGSATDTIAFYGGAGAVQAAALTAADASVVDGTYGAEEAAVIANMRTRLGQIEAILEGLGLCASN